ncbi:hypothetical protein KSS87_017575 [Heliosperma pusillum]|nr:hypothetical protein KSS87_017575 [Heliosperma pusillum]
MRREISRGVQRAGLQRAGPGWKRAGLLEREPEPTLRARGVRARPGRAGDLVALDRPDWEKMGAGQCGLGGLGVWAGENGARDRPGLGERVGRAGVAGQRAGEVGARLGGPGIYSGHEIVSFSLNSPEILSLMSMLSSHISEGQDLYIFCSAINFPSPLFPQIDLTYIEDKYSGISTQALLNVWSTLKGRRVVPSEGQTLNVTKVWAPTNPRGAELLPPGIVVSETDFFVRRLWGLPEEDLTFKPKYLVTFTVGFDQKATIDACVKKVRLFSLYDLLYIKFPLLILMSQFSENFTIVLFHYDGRTTEWDEFEWSKRAIHVSARKQTKWLRWDFGNLGIKFASEVGLLNVVRVEGEGLVGGGWFSFANDLREFYCPWTWIGVLGGT